MEKEYEFEVKVVWSSVVFGENKEEAKDNLIETFKEEFNFEPTDKEIKFIS